MLEGVGVKSFVTSVHRALLGVCSALLVHVGLFLSVDRALLSVHRALLSECRSLSVNVGLF